MTLFGLILWHINHRRLFNAKSSLSVYINKWLGLVWFYGISTTVGYLMPNPLYIYIYMIWFAVVLWHINHCRLFTAKSSLSVYINKWLGLVWFGLVLWHINYCWLFNAKSSLYIYIYIWFGLQWFYDISTIVGYLTPNIYTYILKIWFCHDIFK